MPLIHPRSVVQCEWQAIIAIAHANFWLHAWQFCNNVYMHIYLHSYRQCLMSTFQYLLWSSHSVQSLVVPTQRVVFCWYKSATVRGSCTSWMSLHLWWKSSMSLHRNRWKAVLVLSSLKTYIDILFECFIASASSGPFQILFSGTIPCQLVTFYICLRG